MFQRLALVLLVTLASITAVPGADGDKTNNKTPATATVIAEGAGITSDEALKDAFRNAVRQVVGAVVDAETLVKNDEVISDRVLTYSNGFVRTYDEISKKRADGLVRVTIRAVVERRTVIAKLKEAKVGVKEVDGKGLFSEVITNLEAEKNAKALVAKSLDGFPLNCLQGEVIGKPIVVQKKDTSAKIALKLRFFADRKSYGIFADKFTRTLTKVARESGDFRLEFQGNVSNAYGQPYYLPTKRNRSHSPFVERFWPEELPRAFDKRLPRQGTLVVVNTQLSASNAMSAWRCYLFDESVQEALFKPATSIVQAKVSLLDKDGRAVVTDRFPVKFNGNSQFFANLVTPVGTRDKELYMHGPEELARGKAGCSFFIISPLFFGQQTTWVRFMPEIRMERTMSLSLDDLKSVESVQVELFPG